VKKTDITGVYFKYIHRDIFGDFHKCTLAENAVHNKHDKP